MTVFGIKAFLAAGPPIGRERKVSDGGGLYIVVTRKGASIWVLRFSLAGRPRNYSIGAYPVVTLEEARRQRDQIKAQIAQGVDPVAARRVRRATLAIASDNTFTTAYLAWLDKKAVEWSAIHLKTSKQAIERDVLPKLGRLPVGEITPALLTPVIEAIAKRGAVDTAYKILQHCSGIFRLSQAKGWCKDNPAIPIHEVLPRRKNGLGMPAVLDFPGLGEILRKADTARLSPAVRMAHRLAAFSTARMGNVTQAEWSEFHLDEETPYWLIPRRKMKAHDRPHDHKIILCRPIAQELLAWRTLMDGDGYLFPTPTRAGNGDQPISREAVEKAYRETLGLKDRHTPHGWRAAFSTLAKDNGFSRDVVELALDHVHDNDVVRAYDRGERMAERIKLMDWWGDHLAAAQLGGNLVPFRAKTAA
jgi:integrase